MNNIVNLNIKPTYENYGAYLNNIYRKIIINHFEYTDEYLEDIKKKYKISNLMLQFYLDYLIDFPEMGLEGVINQFEVITVGKMVKEIKKYEKKFNILCDFNFWKDWNYLATTPDIKDYPIYLQKLHEILESFKETYVFNKTIEETKKFILNNPKSTNKEICNFFVSYGEFVAANIIIMDYRFFLFNKDILESVE